MTAGVIGTAPRIAIDGVIVLDKPTAMSSARAVDLVKRRLGAQRAGHGGTLDPLATGVLPICLGAATKLAAYLLADDKAYDADGLLWRRDRHPRSHRHRMTATRPADEVARVTREQLLAAIAARTGEHDQLPPMYSRASSATASGFYRHARAGRDHRARRTPDPHRSPRAARVRAAAVSRRGRL